MRFLMKIFMITGFLLINLHLKAQILKETQISHSEIKSEQSFPVHSFKAGENIAGSMLGLGFWFYKTAFSSQDIGSCSFIPSCSEYAIQSIEKKGLLIGYFMTFDRLSRCNSLSRAKYKTDTKTGLLIDDVD